MRILIFCICLSSSIAILFLYILNTSKHSHNQVLSNISIKEISKNQPTITIKQVFLQKLSKNKKFKTIFKTEKSTFNHTSEIVECFQITSEVFKKNNKIGTLNALQASIDQKKKLAFFIGPIHGCLQELKFSGSNIMYDFSKNIIDTQEQAWYTHPSFNFSAKKSTVQLETQTIFMEKVTTEFLYCSTTNNSSQ